MVFLPLSSHFGRRGALRKPMKAQKFPVTVSELGVSARIRKTIQLKSGREYTAYVVEYTLLGKRTREWRTDFDDAKRAALEACRKIANGEQHVLQLKNQDRLIYLRALEALRDSQVPLDVAASELARALVILNGKGTLSEASRYFADHHSTVLPKISVSDAVEKFLEQSESEGKSKDYQKHLSSALHRFSDSFNIEVSNLAPRLISD